MEDQLTGATNNQWLMAKVNDLSFSLHKYQYEIKLLFTLSSISISETLKVKEDVIISEQGKDLCKIDIDIYDIYSPNLGDTEILVHVSLSKLYWMFDPIMINDAFKFFRNTKSYLVKDIEKLNIQLMEKSE